MFAGVGERTREGNDLYREMIESGVIKLGDKQVSVDNICFSKHSAGISCNWLILHVYLSVG